MTYIHKNTASCPVCGSILILKREGKVQFFRCIAFPDCTGSRPFKQRLAAQIPELPTKDGQNKPDRKKWTRK